MQSIDPLSSTDVKSKELLSVACLQLELGAAGFAATLAKELSLAVGIDEFNSVNHDAVVHSDACHDLCVVKHRKQDELFRLTAFEPRPSELCAAKGVAKSLKHVAANLDLAA